MPYADLAKVLAAAGRTFDAIDVCLGTIDPQQGLGHEQRQRAAASQVSAVAVDASSHGASGTFFSTTDELIAELDRRSLTGDMEGALGLIQRFVRACVFDRRAVTKVFADSRLDERCRRVGEARLAQLCDAGGTVVDDQVDCVILATELYRLGGHTAVIGDLLKTQRFGPRTVVMLTDAFNSADPSIIGERFGSAAIGEIAPKGGLAEKLTWTLNRLRARRPRRLILMNHHNDAVAIAAAQPSLAEETIFYHHCDHQLCLGVTLPHTVHVDPHPMGFYNCRDVIGVSNVVYWPFAADDLGGRTESAWKADGRIRTCSSGSNNKFESPYKYMYAEIIPRVMACTGGVHVHIGPLSVGTLAKIRKALMQLDVPPQRFVHVPWVRSVWKALQSFHIDIVLASFPQGGGKALIEAMGAGIPVIGHDCYISPFLGGADLYYPGAFFWTHPDELLEHLNCLSPARLERESQQARQHFEQLHTNEALSRAIDGGADAPLVPDRRPHKADPLQLFLDDVHYAAQDYSIHVNLIK
nr:glycosyltransferase family 4 protein [Trinickia symbiotica]